MYAIAESQKQRKSAQRLERGRGEEESVREEITYVEMLSRACKLHVTLTSFTRVLSPHTHKHTHTHSLSIFVYSYYIDRRRTPISVAPTTRSLFDSKRVQVCRRLCECLGASVGYTLILTESLQVPFRSMCMVLTHPCVCVFRIRNCKYWWQRCGIPSVV
jgi:hypothetical protein